MSGRQFISFPATWCHSCWRLIGQSSLYSLLIGQGPGLAVRHLRGHSADQHHGHGNPGRWDEEWLMWPCILWLWPDLTLPPSLPPLPLRYCDVILRDVTGNEQWITMTSTPTVRSGCGLDDGKEIDAHHNDGAQDCGDQPGPWGPILWRDQCKGGGSRDLFQAQLLLNNVTNIWMR